jgi:hypothetical protein
VAIGLALDVIDHRVEQRRLHVLQRGVYAVGHRAIPRHGHWRLPSSPAGAARP